MEQSRKLIVTIAITIMLFIPTVTATQSPPLRITTILSDPAPQAGSTLQFNITIQNIRPEQLIILGPVVETDWTQEGKWTSPITLDANGQYNTVIPVAIPLNASIGRHTYVIRVGGNTTSYPFGIAAEEYYQITPAPTPTPTPVPTDNPTVNPTSNPTNTPASTYTATLSPKPPIASPTQNTTPTTETTPAAPEISTSILLSILVLLMCGVVAIRLRKKS